ncbi:MAG: DUF4412 domain-containing protein [Pseudomonadota bacterium]
MSRNYSIISLLSLVVLIAIGAPTHAKTMQEWAADYGIPMDASYDATRLMETKEGRMSFKERKAPGKSRMEMSMGGMHGTMIMREDLGKSYFLMPDMGMYREVDLREASSQTGDSMQVSRVEEVGRETINGFDSRKFKTRFKDQHGKGAGFMWITDQGVPIKMDMIYKSRGMKGQRMKIELTELNMRNQDPAHFELDPELKPMNMGALMGMAGRIDQQTGGTRANKEPTDSTIAEDMAEDVGDAAASETRRSVINETRRAVRKGLRGLFGQ